MSCLTQLTPDPLFHITKAATYIPFMGCVKVFPVFVIFAFVAFVARAFVAFVARAFVARIFPQINTEVANPDPLTLANLTRTLPLNPNP